VTRNASRISALVGVEPRCRSARGTPGRVKRSHPPGQYIGTLPCCSARHCIRTLRPRTHSRSGRKRGVSGWPRRAAASASLLRPRGQRPSAGFEQARDWPCCSSASKASASSRGSNSVLLAFQKDSRLASEIDASSFRCPAKEGVWRNLLQAAAGRRCRQRGRGPTGVCALSTSSYRRARTLALGRGHHRHDDCAASAVICRTWTRAGTCVRAGARTSEALDERLQRSASAGVVDASVALAGWIRRGAVLSVPILCGRELAAAARGRDNGSV
jgi:hypothetical protein